MAQRHELIIALGIGKSNPATQCTVSSARSRARFRRSDQCGELALARHPIEAADAHVDRMDLAPAEQPHDLVADLLQLQPAPHDIGVVVRHLDGAGIAEEIRRMQHVDVQHVALDPFAAIQQPAQLADRLRNRDAERVLHRVHGAHLVGDGADAANARGDVRCLGEGTPAQEGLEEARRLEDAQLGDSTLPSRTMTEARPRPSTRARKSTLMVLRAMTVALVPERRRVRVESAVDAVQAALVHAELREPTG